MADLFDYMDWRGDLSFRNSPANEADCYLISKIGCPNLTGIVPADEQEAPLGKVVEAYRAKNGKAGASLGITTSPKVIDSFYRLPSVPRFQSLMLSGYRKIDDSNNTEQFSALTVRIPDGTRYITFRGTDDNIFAWKENFRMSMTAALLFAGTPREEISPYMPLRCFRRICRTGLSACTILTGPVFGMIF